MEKKCLMVCLIALFILSVLTSGSVMASQEEPGPLAGELHGVGPFYTGHHEPGPGEGGQVQEQKGKPQ